MCIWRMAMSTNTYSHNIHQHNTHQLIGLNTRSMSSHIQGMLITFCISVALITGFIAHKTEQVRKHQQTLSDLREQQWRERRIWHSRHYQPMPPTAASPISTISLLLEELDESDPKRQWLDPQLFTQLQQQTQRCSDALPLSRIYQGVMILTRKTKSRQILGFRKW